MTGIIQHSPGDSAAESLSDSGTSATDLCTPEEQSPEYRICQPSPENRISGFSSQSLHARLTITAAAGAIQELNSFTPQSCDTDSEPRVLCPLSAALRPCVAITEFVIFIFCIVPLNRVTRQSVRPPKCSLNS